MKKVILLLLLSTLCFTSCISRKSSVDIDGQFFGQADKQILLEELSPSGSTIVDSTQTDKNGKFSFEIKSPNTVPTFYNIHLSDSYVPVLVEPGEEVEISAVGNIFLNYTVQGSKGSALIREFNTMIRNKTLELDSILYLYEMSGDTIRTQELGLEYGGKYIELKRNAIQFIVANSNSLAALLPLYHPRADGQFMFDQPEDYIYFQMVSDSLSSKYPSSPYSISLKNDLQKVINSQQMDSVFQVGLETLSDFPDIVMKDATGKNQKLSDHKGKVVLLDFTASNPTELKVINRELVDTYEKYADKDLVVFQVSLDNNKAQWLRTVSDGRLPWISVCDFKGETSPAVQTYNVRKIPANFLIDSQGNIVGRNLYGVALEVTLDKLFTTATAN